ncbi:hypothetical protein FG152_18115 [Ochrobactrum sp. XJ1]|nr:hypothetical protein [Ochrobactrum sp. XJ1]
MKKLFAAMITSTMLLVPVAQAQQWKEQPRHDRRVQEPRYDTRKNVQRKKWSKGQRMSDWRRYNSVRDHRRYGLRAPGRGQQWIRVGNDYVLVSIATGVIAGLVAGSR